MNELCHSGVKGMRWGKRKMVAIRNTKDSGSEMKEINQNSSSESRPMHKITSNIGENSEMKAIRTKKEKVDAGKDFVMKMMRKAKVIS